MNRLLKQILIAAGLLAICVLILAATKAYGVWVISGIAVVLVAIGLLRKERASPVPGDDGAGTPGSDGKAPPEGAPSDRNG